MKSLHPILLWILLRTIFNGATKNKILSNSSQFLINLWTLPITGWIKIIPWEVIYSNVCQITILFWEWIRKWLNTWRNLWIFVLNFGVPVLRKLDLNSMNLLIAFLELEERKKLWTIFLKLNKIWNSIKLKQINLVWLIWK